VWSPLSFGGASEARRLEVTAAELLSDPARDWRRRCWVCACACACVAARLLGAGEGSIGALMLAHGEAAAARLLECLRPKPGYCTAWRPGAGAGAGQGTRVRAWARSGQGRGVVRLLLR
jgi:hypothetical protein